MSVLILNLDESSKIEVLSNNNTSGYASQYYHPKDDSIDLQITPKVISLVDQIMGDKKWTAKKAQVGLSTIFTKMGFGKGE